MAAHWNSINLPIDHIIKLNLTDIDKLKHDKINFKNMKGRKMTDTVLSIVSWSKTTDVKWTRIYFQNKKDNFVYNVNKLLMQYSRYILPNMGCNNSAKHLANLYWTDTIINKMGHTGTLSLWVLGNHITGVSRK